MLDSIGACRADDVLPVAQAGYRAAQDDAEWLGNILEAIAPFAGSAGIAAMTLGPATDSSRIQTFVGRGLTSDFERRMRCFDEAIDSTTAETLYAPTEFVGNAEHRLLRIARDRGVAPEALTGGTRLSAWALLAGDPRTRAIAIAFPASNGNQFDPEHPFPHARRLGLAGAHLGAALRLRRVELQGHPVTPDDENTEAVITPDGRVLHVSGDARTSGRRLALIDAVACRERARGRLRHVDAQEAASLWSALVEGRWSIVDFADHDGKRMLLARRNALGGPKVEIVTDDERDALWLATHGHSHKYIAYELGISPSAVVRRLGSAMRKIGIKSRRDLLRILGNAPSQPVEEHPGAVVGAWR